MEGKRKQTFLSRNVVKSARRKIMRETQRALRDLNVIAEEEMRSERTGNNLIEKENIESSSFDEIFIEEPDNGLGLDSNPVEQENFMQFEDSVSFDSSNQEGESDLEINVDSVEIIESVLEEKCSQARKQTDFKDMLASWAVLPGIKHVHVNKLLSVLRQHPCHADLPVDVRTLIKTPRVVVLHDVHPGKYYHFGVLKGIQSVLSIVNIPLSLRYVDLFINVDGLPISESTNDEFWVIGAIVRKINGLQKKVFVIGIYHGKGKPSDPNSFLRELVNELRDLMSIGFDHFGENMTIRNCSFICDSPARSFITCVRLIQEPVVA